MCLRRSPKHPDVVTARPRLVSDPDRRAAEPLDRTACRPLGVSTRVTSGEPPVAGNTPATSEFL